MDRFSAERLKQGARAALDRARAFCVRHGIDRRHAVGLGAVLVVAVVAAGAARGGSWRQTPIDPGEMIRIEVVPPVEPVFTAGPVMEVGRLVDEFEYVPPPPTPGPDPYPDAEIDRYDDKGAAPRFFRRFGQAIEEALPGRRDEQRLRRDDRSYGFDGPRPDYAEERRARREHRDRIEAERRADAEWRRERERDDRRREDRQAMDGPPHDDASQAKAWRSDGQLDPG